MFFYSPRFLPKSCKHEDMKLKICVDLQNTRGGKLKLFKSHKKPRKRWWQPSLGGGAGFPNILTSNKEKKKIVKIMRLVWK
jgi:hypothetical protein